MKALDTLEPTLTKRLTEVRSGLQLVTAMRKLLGSSEQKAPKTQRKTPKPLITRHLSAAGQRRITRATKAYWRGVKAGEIKRKGFKVKTGD